MKRLYALVILLLPLMVLAGCNTLGNVGTVLSVNTPQLLTPERLYQIHAAYEVFQSAAVSVRSSFHQCRASEAPSVSNPCYKRTTYLAVQTIDRQAAQTIANIDAWAKNNPTIDASALIDGFNRAVLQGTAIVNAVRDGKG